jgi:hypothetical protein
MGLSKDAATRIDFGCAIEGGTFDAAYGDGAEPTITTSGGNMTLMVFFLKLVGRLQRLGTVPAIEIEKYLAAIDH